MRELKYEVVGGGSSGHPELEEIAAYLDGRLSRSERAGITRHLSVCDECLELFAETKHNLGATSAGTAGGEVLPFASRPSLTWRWLPYAAAAVLIVVIGVAGYRASTPELILGELLKPLQETPGLAAAVWQPEVLRGLPKGISEASVLSFLAGAHLVGYRVAVAAEDSDVAGREAQQLANQFEAAGELDSAVRQLREAQFALEDGQSTRKFAGLIEEASAAAEARFFPVHLDFGTWAQGGHIAGRTGNRAWFERRKNRRFLSYLLRQDEEEIEPEAREALEGIREVWDRGEMGPAELAALAGRFEAVLERYQRLSEQETFFPEE